MDEVSLVKKEISTAEWIERIQECRASGLTVKEWCALNNINIKTYYYHLRRTREKIVEQIPVPICTTSGQDVQSVSVIRLHFDEIVVEIPNGMSEQTITAVMRALKE